MFALRTSLPAAAHGRRAASSIALKYSNALFSAALAKSPQALTKVQTELNTISKSIADSPELNAFVSNPTLSAKERAAGLNTLYAKAEGPKKELVSDVTKNLFTVLSDNGRLSETQGVIQGFNELVAKHRGELEVTVTSAAPLPKDSATRLETVLKQSQAARQAKSVKVVNKVNPSLMGGIIVDFGDKSIDLSVSSRVNKLNNILQAHNSRESPPSELATELLNKPSYAFCLGNLVGVKCFTLIFLEGFSIDPQPCLGCSKHKQAPTTGDQTPAKEESKGKLAPIFSQAQGSNLKPSITSSDTNPGGPSKKKRKVDVSSSGHSNKRAIDVTAKVGIPLAERLRPQSLGEFIGQKHLTGPNSLLRSLAGSRNLGSIILWGPPGCGKTTLSRLLAKESDSFFKELSATSSGINDVRNVFEEAKGSLALTGRKTVLFLDEIHRFNKSQQDIFLPYIEKGQIQMIGATTENPSFKLTGALMSRCRVFTLERLTDEEMQNIISRAVERFSSTEEIAVSLTPQQLPSSQGSDIFSLTQGSTESNSGPYPSYPRLTTRVITSLISLAAGDARTALSLLELVLVSKDGIREDELLASLRQSVSCSYDRTGESHYDMISALHKSVRGSQGDAAMYWLARMLIVGEDPLYISRRLVVIASEDVGLADNQALPLAIATLHACQQVGMPECRINLAHLVAYLSEAPKSTRAYEAYNAAETAARMNVVEPVPMAMRNAPTVLMKQLGYAEGYRYNPQYAHPVYNDYLPPAFRGEYKFLKKPDDVSGKVWDEDALVRWEVECNEGRLWSGRRPGIS